MHSGWYDRRTRRVRDLPCGPHRIFLEFEVRRVDCRSCRAVKREALDFLSDSPFYTKHFAYYVGGAVAARRSRMLPRNCAWIGTASRRWTRST
ncbi:MAG: transposase family protein [Dokdonella sp.]|nr:transposase family protein [Dokdonella sp.]